MNEAQKLAIARAALHEIGQIAVEPGDNAMPALIRAQRIADVAQKVLDGFGMERVPPMPPSPKKPMLRLVE